MLDCSTAQVSTTGQRCSTAHAPADAAYATPLVNPPCKRWKAGPGPGNEATILLQLRQLGRPENEARISDIGGKN